MGRKRKLVTGWRLLFACAVAFVVFMAVNNRHARSAPVRGFYPPGAHCIVSSWDFPRAWTSLLRGDVFERMQEDWPRPYGDLELRMRLATGIRPTPVRWGLWFGPRAVFAFSREGTGFTAHPGKLLRWADALHTALGYGAGADGIAQYRGLFYAWREGYLVASDSRAYVAAALSGETTPRMHSDSDALLTVQWEGEHRGFVNVMPGKGLPVTGQLEFTAADGPNALTLPQAWPSEPVVSLTARKVDDLRQVWSSVDMALARTDAYRALRSATVETLAASGLQAPPGDWADSADHVSIAVLDVDTEAAVPVPGVALALRFADDAPDMGPAAALFAQRPSLPFEWNGNPGFVAPLLGTELSACVAKTQREWLLTTREPLMASVAGSLADGPACAAETDIALRASWEKIGEVAEALVRRLGANGALPRMSLDDVNADIVPIVTALSKLGAISLDGAAREGTLKFSGHLAQATGDATR